MYECTFLDSEDNPEISLCNEFGVRQRSVLEAFNGGIVNLKFVSGRDDYQSTGFIATISAGK